MYAEADGGIWGPRDMVTEAHVDISGVRVRRADDDKAELPI